MARTPRGREVLERAKKLLSRARTADELRRAQAVVLPLEYGFSMERTAAIIGVSKGWASQLRTKFIRTGGAASGKKRLRGGRRRENMSYDEEKAFLAPFMEKAAQGGILVAGEVKQELDSRLGRSTALASAYNLLHRHGWRKLAPDTRHPKADREAQEEWKKNSPGSSPASTGNGQEPDQSG
jgi:transposase